MRLRAFAYWYGFCGNCAGNLLHPVVHLLLLREVGLLGDQHRARVLDLGQRLQRGAALRLRLERQRQVHLKLLQPVVACGSP